MAQVFNQLKNANILTYEVPKEGYKPRNYDLNAQYEYHIGQIGHSIDTCWRFKNKVEDLIQAKLIQAESLEMNEITSSNSFFPSHMETSSGPSSAANVRDLFLPSNKVAHHMKRLGLWGCQDKRMGANIWSGLVLFLFITLMLWFDVIKMSYWNKLCSLIFSMLGHVSNRSSITRAI